MTIHRNGQEYVLTEDELFFAYQEQEHIFDRENVQNFFADMDSDNLKAEYGCSREQLEELFEQMAYELRRNMDKYEMSFEYALPDAIKTVLFEHGYDGNEGVGKEKEVQ